MSLTPAYCGQSIDHNEHPFTSDVGDVMCVGKAPQSLTTEQKVDALYQFVILELKPLLTMLAENPMALMSGGVGGMPQMPPPPKRSGR